MNFLTLLLMLIPVTIMQSAYTAMPGKPSQADQKKDKSKEGPLLYPKIRTIVNEKGEKKEVVAPTRTLLIFLDDSECVWEPKILLQNDPAISIDSCVAILQKASPILLSASLLKNVLGGTNSKEATEIIDKILLSKKHDSYFNMRRIHINNFFNFFTAAAIYYELEKWHIYEVSSSLYLLIPPDYSKKIAHDSDATEEVYDPEEITLGLKLPEAKRIRSFDAFKKKIHDSEPHATSTQDFLDCLFLNKLFITEKYYADKALAPQWVIVIQGHGLINHSIASIPIKQFPTVLNFFNTQLSTKLLVYKTCYAQGTNYTQIFGDLRSEKKETYNYSIASAGFAK